MLLVHKKIQKPYQFTTINNSKLERKSSKLILKNKKQKEINFLSIIFAIPKEIYI